MNRFSNRVVSLVLAVAFLFSAAAVSFFTLFRGVTAFAADSNDLSIVSATASTKTGETDLLKESITTQDIDNLVVVVEDKSAAGLVGYTAALTGAAFTPSGIDPSTIAKIGETKQYTVTFKKARFTSDAGNSLEITFTKTGTSETRTVSRTTKQPIGNDSYSITNAGFFDSAGTPLSSVSGGATGTFVITIEDSAIDATAFKERLTAGDITLRLNKDCFQPSATKGWRIEEDSIHGKANGGVTYNITFEDMYYTGKDKTLLLYINYKGSGLPERSFSYDVPKVKVTETSSRTNNRDDDDDEKSSSHPDIAPPTPTLIVSSFDYGGATVTAASNFTLKLVVTNTSKKLPIDNIVVKVTVPEAFTMNGSSNSFYIEKLLKDSSKELTLNLSVKPNAEPISHPIKIAFGFESVIDEVRKPLTADQDISIPVGQLDRFTLNSVEVPGEIYVGEDSSFEVSFVNKGKTPVYNISAEITGNIAQPGQLQFMGNLESGKEDSADFLLGALEGGVVTGEVVITYEDANMHVTELRTPFTSNAIVMDMGKQEMEVSPTDVPPVALPWYQTVWNAVPIWGWMGGGVAVIIFAAFTVKLVRAHREKKREEQDEDF